MQSDSAPSALIVSFGSWLRQAVAAGAGALAAKGVITVDQQELVVAAIMAVASLAWSLYANHKKTQALQAAIDAPIGKATP